MEELPILLSANAVAQKPLSPRVQRLRYNKMMIMWRVGLLATSFLLRWNFTNDSEEHNISIFRVQDIVTCITVTKDWVRIGNWIYWLLTGRNYE
jgi:hypothetical protein